MPLDTTRPEIAGTLGAVASTHWLASAAGMGVLERGGNAADAACAAGFVLQVVEPHLNGPGGDLPLILHDPAEGRTHVVCGQGVVPGRATPAAFADLGLDAVPGSGLLAATVPGAFGAWTLLLQRWGTWRLRDVLEPALGYARGGAPVLPRVSATLEAVGPLFTGADGRPGAWSTSAATYLDAAGRPPAPWSRLRLTALAETYERVLAHAEATSGDRERQCEAARDHFYRGPVAEAVDAFASSTAWRDTSGGVHGGLLRGDDLAAWEPTVEAPVVGEYRGVQVAKTGPWGQGPVLLQALALLDGVDLSGSLDGDGWLREDDAGWVHLATEALDLAMSDREAWYGDPVGAADDGVEVPLADLLDPGYTAARRALLDPARAAARLRPGSPGGRTPLLPAPLGGGAAGPGGEGPDPTDAAFGEPTVGPSLDVQRGDTVHVDVVDRWGGAVSATPSGGWLQSSPVVPALGFPLGTRAQMCWLQPGLPSSLRPGRRPRTTLSPALLLRDGAPWVALGTPGGDQQDAWQLPLVLRLVHAAEASRRRGEPSLTGLQRAVDAPTFHTATPPSSFWPREAEPGRLVVEDRFAPGVLAELARRGHDVRAVDGWSLGRLSAVARDGEWVRAAANPRGGQGYAVGR